MANGGGRSLVAGTDARRTDKAHLVAGIGLQLFEKLLTAGHHAGQRGANANGAGGRGILALADKVEMIIEAGDFPDFRHRQSHPGCQRRQMARRKMVELILQAMQIFDQQVAARCLGAKTSLDFAKRGRVGKPALRLVIAAATAGFAALPPV